jgi:23S rRNA pseudouridine1911/1915/1917 synthase
LRELLAYEIANGGQVSIVNRLDRETSGVTLGCQTPRRARALHLEMQARAIEKEYLALVWGWPRWRNLKSMHRSCARAHAKPSAHSSQTDGSSRRRAARTRFRLEKRFVNRGGDASACCAPFQQTGRMHQIRVHLAHAGCRSSVTKSTDPTKGCYLEFIETGWTPALAERLLLPRHALHSAVLRLPRRQLAWSAPLATDIAAWVGENLLATPESEPI